jgi:transposase
LNAYNIEIVSAGFSPDAKTHNRHPPSTIEELERRYRQAKDPVERSHYQIIWLLAQGKPTEEVATVTGYSRTWIYELVRGYNQVGATMLGDLRHQNPGAAPKFTDVQQANLLQALRGTAPDGGLWNGRKVADYLRDIKSVYSDYDKSRE